MCISLCTTVVHNTAQSSSDYLLSYSPDQHQSLDTVYWREVGPGVDLWHPDHEYNDQLAAAPWHSTKKWTIAKIPLSVEWQEYRSRHASLRTHTLWHDGAAYGITSSRAPSPAVPHHCVDTRRPLRTASLATQTSVAPSWHSTVTCLSALPQLISQTNLSHLIDWVMVIRDFHAPASMWMALHLNGLLWC